MRFMWVAANVRSTMRDEVTAPTVPEVSSESTATQPAIRADGGQREHSAEALVGDSPLVPDLS
jgi:hypothetical protein